MNTKFPDINFGESGRVDRASLGIWLPGRYWGHKNWFEIAWTQIQQEWPNLDWTGPQTAETLFNSRAWKSYDVGFTICATCTPLSL